MACRELGGPKLIDAEQCTVIDIDDVLDFNGALKE